MPRLLVLTPAELTRDPRARRAAVVARDRGYDVVGLCGRVAGDTPSPLDGVEVVRVGGDAVSAQLRRRGLGGMHPSRPPVRELRGAFRLARLARLTAKLISAGRRLGRFDVVHANDFDTLPAAWELASKSGARLVYDSHELYTTQELDPPRSFVAVASRVEAAIATHADAVVTTGRPFAEELQRRFGLRQEPLIVLNCPDLVTTEPSPTPADGKLRVIYQAAMGPGRPLQDVVDAARRSNGVEFTLRVVGMDEAALRREIARAGVGDVVHIADPVPPDRLVEALQGFHVGLIINRPLTLTDELVVPNKLFEYMMAGLAVVAPRLPGLAAIVDGDGVGSTFEPGRPDRLAAVLGELDSDRELLNQMRKRARQLALDRYNAPAQAAQLLRAWGGAVSNSD